jgi:DNA-binding response OmpR family regulator
MPSEFRHRALAGRRILIVEDRYFVADDLRQLFAKSGAEVIAVVADVEEAKRIAETDKIDLAVLDVDLRGRDVFDAVGVLEARGTPFIFVTGYRETHLPEQYRGRPIVSKPFSEPELFAKVCAALETADGTL